MNKPSRQELLETCFTDIPQQVGNITLRPLSAASFALLGRLESPMMTGGGDVSSDDMFKAVILYIWVHSADIKVVASIQTKDDLPLATIEQLGFEIEFGKALGFLELYKRSSARMSAALAEVDEGDAEPGKPMPPSRAGSPPLSSPLADAPIPQESDTSSGSSPLSVPSPTSMPPMPPTEQEASGLVLLPDLTTAEMDSGTPS